MKPILSIIIVSFNTSKLTVDCLVSIAKDQGLKQIPYEIIVVDNNSTDNSVAILKKLKNIKLLLNKENRGFGAGNNQGLKAAQGEFILFLNSDTIIHHSAISQSVDWLSSHPEASACTAQLLNSDKSIQPSGGFFPNILNIFTWSIGLDDLPFVNNLIKPFHPHGPDFYTHDSFYTNNHAQDWLTGAFLLTRKNILDSIAGFDENYFMYGEEVELCYRIHQKYPKLSMHYLVGSQITHLGGGSSAGAIYTKANQGLIKFFEKHKPRWQTILIKLFLHINSFLRSTVYKLFTIRNYATKNI